NLCKGLPTHKNKVTVPVMDKPPFGKPYKDPVFGAKVIRISDTQKGEVVKPMYSTIQSWNADESLMILYHTGGNPDNLGHHLYDGKTYKHLRKLDITAKDIEELYWHHTDPNVFFYVSANYKDYGYFMKYDVAADKATKVADFMQYCGREGVPVSGNDVQMPPLSDDRFGFRCNDGRGQETGFIYEVSTDKTWSVPMGEGLKYDPWNAPMLGPSGKNVRLMSYILDDTLKENYELDLYEYHSHASLGRLANGHDALFATAFDPAPGGCDGGPDKGVGSLTVHDFEEKTCRVVVGEFNGYGYPGSGTHVSAVGHKVPGWALMSTIGYYNLEYLSNNKQAPLLFSEIWLVNTDPANFEVCRIAHHHSWAKAAENVSYHGYLGEPHATLSPSGTRLVFGSDWKNSGSVDTYVVELPAYVK
ncbi:MAG: hypothetical protein KDJ38_15245, partial [Gammaproteobacteria bacterium]|nr:hypothetical protein [Gammaproteobacteria bacterium]